MPFETNYGIWLGTHKKQGLRKPHSDTRMPRIKVCRVQCGQKGWGPGYKPFSPCPELTEEISLYFIHKRKAKDVT